MTPKRNLDLDAQASGNSHDAGISNIASDGTEKVLTLTSGLDDLNLSEGQSTSNVGSMEAMDGDTG